MGYPKTPVETRLLQRIKVSGGCWLYTGCTTKDGYGVIDVGGRTQKRVHRVSYELFVGPIPEGQLVCHRCDTPLCVNPSHLFLGSPKDNSHDMVSKGRHRVLKGERHPNSKISDSERSELLRLRSDGWRLKDLAHKYGLSVPHVCDLCKAGA